MNRLAQVGTTRLPGPPPPEDAPVAERGPRPDVVLRSGANAFLLLLALPGTLGGVTLLLAMAGVGVPVAMTAQHHGVFQALAFFTLIHVFLTHALPGMLLARHDRVLRVWRPVQFTAATALLSLAAAWLDVAPLAMALRTALAVGTGVTTGILLHAMATARRPWTDVPFVHVVAGLVMGPLGLALWVAQAAGALLGVSAPGVMLVGVATVILGMSYQMFGPMLSLERPSRRGFAVGSGVWAAAALAQALGAWPRGTAVVMAAGALGAVLSLRLHRRRRGLMRHVAMPPSQRVLVAHAWVGMGALAAAPWVAAVSSHPFAADVARHVWALGFCAVVTLGIVERVLPRMLGAGRLVPPSASAAILALLVVGIALRVARLWDGTGVPLVAASAICTGTAIVAACAATYRAMSGGRASETGG